MSQQISATIDPAMKLQTRLPVVTFDYEGLMAWAMGMTEKYSGLVVEEDQVKDIKKDMAELNASKIRVDNARKETAKVLMTPIKEFEARVKKVCGVFDDAYRALGEQVKLFEDKERDAKREVVKGVIEEELAAQTSKIRPFPITVQDKWLNKTTSLKSIREAIQGIIAQRIETEALQRQAEQARQERAAAIEQAVKATNARHGISLNVAGFMVPKFTSLDTPLEKAMAAIEDVAENAAAATKPRQGTLSPQVSPAPVAPLVRKKPCPSSFPLPRPARGR